MKNRKIYLSVILAVLFSVSIILLDLLTKHFIIANLIPKVGDSIDVIPGFINFIYVKNTGAAWGIMAGRPVFLIIISILVLGIYVFFYGLKVKKMKDKTSKVLGISVGLIAGGCIGNLVDRIAFGYVRDFINFQFMNFPVFNFADIALTFGIILMVVYFLFISSKEDGKNLKKQVVQDKTLDKQINIDLSSLPNQPILNERNENEKDLNKNNEYEDDLDNINENLDKKDKEIEKKDKKTSNSDKGE